MLADYVPVMAFAKSITDYDGGYGCPPQNHF